MRISFVFYKEYSMPPQSFWKLHPHKLRSRQKWRDRISIYIRRTCRAEFAKNRSVTDQITRDELFTRGLRTLAFLKRCSLYHENILNTSNVSGTNQLSFSQPSVQSAASNVPTGPATTSNTIKTVSNNYGYERRILKNLIQIRLSAQKYERRKDRKRLPMEVHFLYM
jgi:hypothetical protein